MNLTLLDRDQLEAILLNPSSEAAQPLVCSDNAVVAYLPVPATARDGRLRHVLAAAHELLTRIAAEAIRGRSLIDSPTVMKDFLRVYFAGAERETFVVVFLDASHRVIEVEELFAGTLTQTSVYPREVVKRALHFKAAAVCLSHVHPSSQTEPSRADEALTSALRQALSTMTLKTPTGDVKLDGNRNASLSDAERAELKRIATSAQYESQIAQNREREITGFYCGDPLEAHRAGVAPRLGREPLERGSILRAREALFGRGSGESFQLAFQGQGWVVLQPYEEVVYAQTNS